MTLHVCTSEAKLTRARSMEVGSSRRSVHAIALLMLLIAAPVFASDPVLTWNSNTEPDIAGYIVYGGTASRQYTWSINVGNRTSALLTNLDPTLTYFFAVRAYNIAGVQSPFSAEVTLMPRTLPVPVWITSVTANRTPPQPIGSEILFTATASGGTAPYEYKWWVVSGQNSKMAQNWSSTNTFPWTPRSADSRYQIVVAVRDATTRNDEPDAQSVIFFPIIP